MAHPRAALAALATASVLAGVGATSAPARPPAGPPPWAPASTSAIHPGVQLFTNGAQCTANFVFTNGAHVYLGQAAECANASTPSGAEGDCTSPSLWLGTPVRIVGARHLGHLVYSSWLAMQIHHERDPNVCRYNNLALVEVDPADVRSVNPSIPVWGGPVGLNSGGTVSGDGVYSYGNSELAMGAAAVGPRQGLSLGDSGKGWSHQLVTLAPGLPGDPGSAFLDSAGRALGVLSTIDVTPVPGSDGVGDLGRELAYLRAMPRFHNTQLALGTQPFTRHR